jgi:hypothetical protein
VILHGDKEFGRQYWAGYKRSMKDHTFTRDKKLAIKFVTRWDAEAAGLYLTHGIDVVEESYD